MKKTKIVCTIGPASDSKTTLRKMMQAGMNVARLNFSHGTYASHRQLIKTIRTAADSLGKTVAIMQDLQGPRIRIGEVDDKGIELNKGDKVVLAHKSVKGFKDLGKGAVKLVPVGYKKLHESVKPQKHILISDGIIDIKVSKVDKGGQIYGTVVKPGTIFSHKGINLPGVTIEADVITPKDKQDLKFGLSQGVNFVALSFVKDGSDIRALRKLIGNKPVHIIAKIERIEALNNFDDILAEADGVMIARGDLGIEVRPSRVPLAQKEMIQKCLVAGKPAIVATQMLESMISNPRPTRAEVSDVANAVIDHTDAVMLSGESAFGQYPVEAVQMMADVVRKTEQSRFDDLPPHYLQLKDQTVEDAVSFVAYDLAQHDKVKAIVVNSLSGRSARMMARHRPETTIIVLTSDKHTRHHMALTWGAKSIALPRCRSLDELLSKSVTAMKKNKLVKSGDNIVLVTGHPVGKASGTNLVKLHTV